MVKQPFTLEWFKYHYTYEPDTGRLFNRKTGRYIGYDRLGYIKVAVKGSIYSVHRLAVFYMTGRWLGPGEEIDHKDWDTKNNKWGNLVITTHLGNMQNRKPKENKWGFKGVRRYVHTSIRNGVTYKYEYYISEAKVENTRYYLGCFKTPEEAGTVYQEFVDFLAALR